MKNKIVFLIGGIFFFSVMLLFGGAEAPPQEIVITPEVEKEFPIKSHHSELSFGCMLCHDGQGDDPKEFYAPGDKSCLACHKTKEFMAKRLKFMDKLHVNPHNSIHDGPTLFCDECHAEHKPSINMCAECHEHDIKIWMKETP